MCVCIRHEAKHVQVLLKNQVHMYMYNTTLEDSSTHVHVQVLLKTQVHMYMYNTLEDSSTHVHVQYS